MRIDVHAHYSPRAYFDRMQELGAFEEIAPFRVMRGLYRSDRSAPGAQRAPDRDDVAGRLADMDAAGIDTQIVCLGAAQPYFRDENKAIEGSRLANDLMAQLIADHPGRFSAFGAIPLPHSAAAAREVARCLDELGFAGICVGCSAAGVTLDDAAFAPVWDELDRRGALLYIHPGIGMEGIAGASDFHIAPDFVSPAEIAVAATRLIVTGTLDRYPRVTPILATTGGSLLLFAQRFDRGLRQHDAAQADALGGFLAQLRRFYYDTSVPEEPRVLALAAELVGADRILLGSDYARPGVTSAGAVAAVENSGLFDDAELAGVLGGTAWSILQSSSIANY